MRGWTGAIRLCRDLGSNGDSRFKLPMVANGSVCHAWDILKIIFFGNPLHKMQPQASLFLGVNGRIAGSEAGDFFEQKQVGRGVGDGRFARSGGTDVVVVHQKTHHRHCCGIAGHGGIG